jgi:hypothetical protein
VVVLHELDFQSGVPEFAIIEGFHEKPSMVLENTRPDHEQARKFGLFYLHGCGESSCPRILTRENPLRQRAINAVRIDIDQFILGRVQVLLE